MTVSFFYLMINKKIKFSVLKIVSYFFSEFCFLYIFYIKKKTVINLFLFLLSFIFIFKEQT